MIRSEIYTEGDRDERDEKAKDPIMILAQERYPARRTPPVMFHMESIELLRPKARCSRG